METKTIRAALAALCVAAFSPLYGDEPYAWLDYVEANADLFVNTGVIAKRGTKVEYTGTYGSPTPSTPNRDVLIGASAGGSGGNANEWGLIRDCNLKISLAYNNATIMSTDVVFPPPDDAMLTIVSEVTLDGTESGISVSGDATGSASGTWNGANLSYPLYLFARNAAGTADKFSRGKCYGLRIWQVPDGGSEYVLVRDFKPFRRAGVVGLYDVVGGRFYHPNESNALVAGNVTEAATPDTTPDAWLDYVEATSAGQYVNTGIKDSFGTKVEYTGTYLGNRNTRAVLIGVQSNNNNHRYYIANNNYTIAVDGQPTGVAFTGTDVNAIYTITSDILPDKTGIITITGAGQDAKTKLQAGYTSAFNLPLFLFCANNNGSGTAFPSYGRCYGLKVWQNGKLVRDFIPCMNYNEAALFDRVSGDVFYSSSADPLVAGNVISEPAARHPEAWLEYIQATTAGQYIDTGVSAKLGTKVEYTGTYLGDTNARSVLIGAQKDNSNTRYLVHNNSHTIANGTPSAVAFTGTDATSVYKLTAAISTDKTATLDITGAATASTTKANNWSASENLSLFLFGANLNGGGVGFPSRGRCFGLKIWQVPDGGSEYVLVRNFRPCLYDGEAALYDTINGIVYKSRSSVPFVSGPVVSDAAPDSLLEYAETKQLNGSPYLNTGIVAKRGTKFEYVGTWCKTTCQSAAGATVLGGVSGTTSSTEFDYWLGRNVSSWMSASKNCQTDIAFPPDENEVFTIVSEILPNTVAADSNFRFIAQSDSHSADMTVAGPNYDTESSIFLFSANGENSRGRDADGKCRSLRIWQVPTGGSEYVLVREFRPCVADGVVGFYDKVSQKAFLPSRGFMLSGPQVKKRGMVIIVK